MQDGSVSLIKPLSISVRFLCIFFVVLGSIANNSLFFASNQVAALPDAEMNKFAQNDILFYDPSESNSNCDSVKVTGDQITWIGDSYSEKAKSIIEKKLSGIDIQASTSLQLAGSAKGKKNGVEFIKDLEKSKKLREYVVIALGANDQDQDMSTYIEDLEDVLDSKKIILVTPITASLTFPSIIKSFKQASESYSNIFIADWAAVASKNLDKYFSSSSDNAMTQDGYKTWVDTIYESIPGASVYTGGTIAISGSTIEEKIWSGLTSFLTAEQAAGVMGNMVHESLFNPAMHEQALKNRYQPGFDLSSNSSVSYGLGLIQWSFGRRVRMYNYVKSVDASLTEYLDDYNTYARSYEYNGAKFLELAGDNVTDQLLSAEIQFLKDELENTSSYKGILETSTVYDAAKFFLEHVEVPQDPYIESHPERAEDAEKYYEQFKNFSGSYCNSTGVQKLIEYVKKYAWPEHHDPVYLTMMPDYKEAISRRSNEGYFVGGSDYPGIDCGGFVTTILNESGFDPNYNFGGKYSKGASAVTSGQLKYLSENQDTWKLVNPSWNTPISDESELSPGDVGFSSCSGTISHPACGHTYLYVGEVEGFATHIASASLDERAPMAGTESWVGSGINWFHKIK